tara:strand:+ start:67 stop:924 length:858 start_codon:yes stop_codon:yes gene_type:complete
MKLDTDPPPEVIRDYIAQQHCWICNKGGWKALSQHLVKKHGIPAAEVREMAYMFKYERLISEELSENMSKDALRRLGDKKWKPKKGEPQSRKVLSTKAKGLLKKRVVEIRPLAALAQRERREAHPCPVCGVTIETSRPVHCSPECSHKALSESARRAMTPERIALFKTIRYKPTPAEQSRNAKEYWRKFKELPPEEQRRLSLEKAASRRVRVEKDCVICGTTFEDIPSHIDDHVACSNRECRRQNRSNKGKGHRHTPESIAKMSQHAKMRHQREGGQFGRIYKEG